MQPSQLQILLENIRQDKACRLFPPLANPSQSTLSLPSDLLEFYQVCNGVELFKDSDYPYRIPGQEELQAINLLVTGELSPNDRSSDWIAIAEDFNGDYLSLDLSEERQGWCYDSFHETHGLVGDTPVIAKSFTELLERLYQNKGGYLYWFQPDFNHLYGDAYD